MLAISYTCVGFHRLSYERWKQKTQVPELKDEREYLRAINSCPVPAFAYTKEGVAALPRDEHRGSLATG